MSFSSSLLGTKKEEIRREQGDETSSGKYSDKRPSVAFGEASNALAVVELPTDAEKPTHTRSLRHSFFQAIGAC
jgi:hypothetical protein